MAGSYTSKDLGNALHITSPIRERIPTLCSSTYKARNWEYYFSYYGITPTEYDAFIATVPQILDSTPMTREQLASALAHAPGVPKQGIWEYKTQRAQTTVKVRMFSTPTTALKKSIEAELERLSAFLNTKVVLEFENF